MVGHAAHVGSGVHGGRHKYTRVYDSLLQHATSRALHSLPSAPPCPRLQVREGLLPRSYRTLLCRAYLDGNECCDRAACSHAHSLGELRVEAGIAVSGGLNWGADLLG